MGPITTWLRLCIPEDLQSELRLDTFTSGMYARKDSFPPIKSQGKLLLVDRWGGGGCQETYWQSFSPPLEGNYLSSSWQTLRLGCLCPFRYFWEPVVFKVHCVIHLWQAFWNCYVHLLVSPILSLDLGWQDSTSQKNVLKKLFPYFGSFFLTIEAQETRVISCGLNPWGSPKEGVGFCGSHSTW